MQSARAGNKREPMSTGLALWIIFAGVVVTVLLLDLVVLHRKPHAVKLKEALFWSAVWVSLALGFSVLVFLWKGHVLGLEFLTAYVVEQSLSIDNLFVFLLIFTYFRVPAEYQHRVLMWGILGALAMRAIIIAFGVALIQQVEWVIYIFGVILIYSGIRMALAKDTQVDPSKNPAVRLLKKFYPISEKVEGAHFFVKRPGPTGKIIRFATPLMVVLVAVEASDLVFATDSIPAVLAISSDTFVVYTSNVFAILGLRSFYFALAGMMRMFRFLHYGLSIILVFVGIKMLLGHVAPVPTAAALATIAAILVISVAASLLIPVKPPHEHRADDIPAPGKINEADHP